ncbi:MAG: PPOX class F420-dependent oxidoreductase [Actinobacteria bacterium]|nr:PPOX class F420-dependent oxidoreductase [Actinomycetota bacterium]
MVISDEKYVLFTTFRKSGEAVSSPVWIAGLADGTAGFTSDLNVGKVKRVRNTPRVTLQACSFGGKPKPGSAVIEATAAVKLGEEAEAIRRAIHRKYWVTTRLLATAALVRKILRRPPVDGCAIQLTLG